MGEAIMLQLSKVRASKVKLEEIRMKRKVINILLVIVVVTGILTGCASKETVNENKTAGEIVKETGNEAEEEREDKTQDSESVKIRFAVQPGDIQPFVAEKLGYFEDAGLDVELIQFSYGPPIIEAFTSKAVDFGLLGDLPVYSGIANNVDLKIIGTYSSSSISKGLLVRDDANIKELSDLKGKKVAVPFGSNSQPLLYLFLEKGGLTEEDVEIINLSFTDSVTSIIAGDIQAAVVGEPQLSLASAEGNGVSIFSDATGLKLFVNPIIGRGEFTDKYPELTSKFLGALEKAAEYATENVDEAATIASDATEIDEYAVKANLTKNELYLALPQEKIDALVTGAEQAYEFELIKEKIDILSYIDTSYLEAAGVQ